MMQSFGSCLCNGLMTIILAYEPRCLVSNAARMASYLPSARHVWESVRLGRLMRAHKNAAQAHGDVMFTMSLTTWANWQHRALAIHVALVLVTTVAAEANQ
jgi:hypothetical protein